MDKKLSNLHVFLHLSFFPLLFSILCIKHRFMDISVISFGQGGSYRYLSFAYSTNLCLFISSICGLYHTYTNYVRDGYEILKNCHLFVINIHTRLCEYPCKCMAVFFFKNPMYNNIFLSSLLLKCNSCFQY